jgi:hypothetical protein
VNEAQRRILDIVQFSNWIATFGEPGRTILGIESYTYSVDAQGVDLATTTAPATGSQDFPLVMDSDSDFVVCFLSGGAVISAPEIESPANANRCVEFSPAILVQITDEAAGKTYFNVPTPLPLIAGAGGFPFVLTSPRIVKPKSTLQITATAFVEGVTFSDFFFSLHGAKIYYAG